MDDLIRQIALSTFSKCPISNLTFDSFPSTSQLYAVPDTPGAGGGEGVPVGMVVGAVLVVVFLGMACVGFVIWR